MTNDFDWSVADGSNQDYTDIYPRIQWHHGKKALRPAGGMQYEGGLFVPADQFPGFSAEGWAEDSFIASSGEEIKGYSTRKGDLAVLRVKKWWGESDDGKKYSKTNMLCCIKGVDGLFSLQVSGVSKGLPMEQAFTAHRNQILAAVNHSKPEGSPGFEPFAVWFVVEPGPHEIQSSGKDSSKSSEVTKPRLHVPAEITLDYCRTLWVGKEQYQKFCQLYRESEPWQLQVPKTNAPDELTHTGFDKMTAQQESFLGDLLLTKSIEVPEIRDMCLTVSEGSTNQLENLTRTEASALIEMVKAY